MQHITKPMLACNCGPLEGLKFPVLGTQKLDGIRCLKIRGKCLSRKFKPIPNKKIREWIEDTIPDNTDGELVIPGKKFSDISSVVMSEDGTLENVWYYVFDHVKDRLDRPYSERIMLMAKELRGKKNVYLLTPTPLYSLKDLAAFEEKCVREGYEGAIIRSPSSPYKLGRSTVREGYMLKIKRFQDAEARVTGFAEKMHNENEAEKDAFGRTKRGHSKEGLVPAGTLGKLLVTDVETGVEFEVGTGYDDALRREIWDHRDKYLGKLITYKFQPSGMKDKPRFPTFKSFRSEDDL